VNVDPFDIRRTAGRHAPALVGDAGTAYRAGAVEIDLAGQGTVLIAGYPSIAALRAAMQARPADEIHAPRRSAPANSIHLAGTVRNALLRQTVSSISTPRFGSMRPVEVKKIPVLNVAAAPSL